LDEISVAPSLVASVKAELSSWPLGICQEMMAQALKCTSATEVRRLLEQSAGQRPAFLVESDLVITGSHSASKEEAIKEVVDRLYTLGRTNQPRVVEAALWQREATYSTGFGHGFAIPHCKTNAVAANSLVLLKLQQPVPWGALDGEPVSVMLLLTMRESEQTNGHMKIFSKLARRLMHEEFREQLRTENDPEKLCQMLRETLQC
jgi:fructose-specific PTS system IIA-like component